MAYYEKRMRIPDIDTLINLLKLFGIIVRI
ncbi:hypothetical protein KII95_07765 [Leuconostoc gelidum subsp. aenigmaticum]|nr:hypothetical protein [Leuconostoc gelidum subsp. aenigmaticum]